MTFFSLNFINEKVGFIIPIKNSYGTNPQTNPRLICAIKRIIFFFALESLKVMSDQIYYFARVFFKSLFL